LQVSVWSFLDTVKAEKVDAVSLVYRSSNITLIADELQSATLHQDWFQESGQPKDVVKTSDITFFDYDTFSIFVHSASKRAVAADASSQLVATSRIAPMMDRLVRESKLSKVTALTFGFVYEAVFEQEASKFLTGKYLRANVLGGLGKEGLRAAGIRLVCEEDDHVVRATLDSVPKNPFAISIYLNYHQDSPPKTVYSDIINRFGQYTADAPLFAGRIVNVA
jgi:hypothetical protein